MRTSCYAPDTYTMGCDSGNKGFVIRSGFFTDADNNDEYHGDPVTFIGLLHTDFSQCLKVHPETKGFIVV